MVAKSVADLVISAKTVCERYRLARMERETVREWVLGLGSYPVPHGDRVRAASDWFRVNNPEHVSDELKQADIEKLEAIFS